MGRTIFEVKIIKPMDHIGFILLLWFNTIEYIILLINNIVTKNIVIYNIYLFFSMFDNVFK